MTDTDLTTLLDGQVKLHQPVSGYRAGMDAVMLAASLTASDGEKLVELGCGPGGALISAALRLPTVSFRAFEVEPEMAALARRNVTENALEDRVEVVTGNIGDIRPEHTADQVFFNPPFYDDASALRAPSLQKRRAWLSGDTPLPAWVKAAAYLLKAQGYLTLVHRADALESILAATAREFGSVIIKPIQPSADRAAKRIIVKVRKGGRAPTKLLPPLVLHASGNRAYLPEALAIHQGAPLVLDTG